MREIESSGSKRTSLREPWAAPPFRHLSTGPCLHCVTVHCLARNRRLASEIPLPTLVAVDRLTSFGSVWRRCTKAPRKQSMRGIESSGSRRTSLREPWAAPPFRHLSTGPQCLHCVTVHCLASSQKSVNGFVSIDEKRSVPSKARPTMLAFPSISPESGPVGYRRVSHGLGWPANAILFLSSVKGNEKIRNTSAPTASNIAHQTN